MTTMTKQRGMTLIGWLLVLAVGGFLLLLVVKLAPVYLEYYSVKSSVQSLKTEPEIGSKSRGEVEDLLQRRLDVNDVNSVTKKDITLTRGDGQRTLSVRYQVQVPILGNVDALVRFHTQVVLR